MFFLKYNLKFELNFQKLNPIKQNKIKQLKNKNWKTYPKILWTQ